MKIHKSYSFIQAIHLKRLQQMHFPNITTRKYSRWQSEPSVLPLSNPQGYPPNKNFNPRYTFFAGLVIGFGIGLTINCSKDKNIKSENNVAISNTTKKA